MTEPCSTIVELRQYTLHPGKRHILIRSIRPGTHRTAGETWLFRWLLLLRARKALGLLPVFCASVNIVSTFVMSYNATVARFFKRERCGRGEFFVGAKLSQLSR